MIFTLTSYGGVRSPDSEVVVRTAQALASSGSFEVQARLEPWPSFGLAPGRGEALFSVFGPLESVLLVPFVALGDSVAASGRYEDGRVPISHYLGKGWYYALRGEQPADRASHGARWPAAWFNAIVGALCIWAFFSLVFTLTQHATASLCLAVLVGFGTPLWAYSGTFFSEPLAILFVLLSLRQLILPYETKDRRASPDRRAFSSGLLLALAVLTHLTAILFAPFFALYLVLERRALPASQTLRRTLAAFLLGIGVGLVLLGFYNFARFGNPLETGRGVDPALAVQNGYGTFVPPGDGLVGLLVSPGKGLFLYVPAVLVGLALWPRFHRRHRSLSWVLALAALFRLIVVASRSDWHGGFALGPRLLMMLVPVLLLPIGSWLADELERGSRRSLRVFLWTAFVLIIEQLYLALGEVFEFLHARRFALRESGGPFDVVFDWANSPLVHSLEAGVGPYLLRPLPVSPLLLWLSGVVLVAMLVMVWGRYLTRGLDPSF